MVAVHARLTVTGSSSFTLNEFLSQRLNSGVFTFTTGETHAVTDHVSVHQIANGVAKTCIFEGTVLPTVH